MDTGFVPNNFKWPITITITNLKYTKSVSTGTTYSTSNAPPSSDLMIFYDEVDTPANAPGAAPWSAAPSFMLTTAALAFAAVLLGAHMRH
jgi:hypothetical protein